jgi:DNA (cytosine-5)-methyltransferase 1
MKVLNLYAGLGGNRKHWKDCDVDAVESDPKILEVYKKLYPRDWCELGDAHQFLLDHYQDYDFIWSSPPCQSHSSMDLANGKNKPRYADMGLYQEIIFLKHYFKGKWVVENVNPYYDPLIPALRLGRHLFWSNFHIGSYDVPRPENFINLTSVKGSQQLKEWLGIEYEGNIYYNGNHNPAQVLANCVHPDLGNHVFNCSLERDLFQ